MSAEKKKFDFNVLVHDLWNGKYPLFQVFWLYYFAVEIALTAAGRVLTPLADIFLLLGLIWAGFMVKPIWLAADKYEGEKSWALLAKVAAIFIGLAVVSDVLF